MNERIKLLAEQATTYIEPTANSGEGWIFDKQKFAELIVRECMGLCYGIDMKDLEKENGRLKRLVADLSLEKQVLKDIASGNL